MPARPHWGPLSSHPNPLHAHFSLQAHSPPDAQLSLVPWPPATVLCCLIPVSVCWQPWAFTSTFLGGSLQTAGFPSPVCPPENLMQFPLLGERFLRLLRLEHSLQNLGFERAVHKPNKGIDPLTTRCWNACCARLWGCSCDPDRHGRVEGYLSGVFDRKPSRHTSDTEGGGPGGSSAGVCVGRPGFWAIPPLAACAFPEASHCASLGLGLLLEDQG